MPEALAFSPSAVSRQLGVLEREAGLPLLERTGRRVRLTPAGQSLVRHAEAVLERLEQAGAELAKARRGPAGARRIGSFPTATRAAVPAALGLLARRRPGLEPMVRDTDPVAVAHALRVGDLDAALIHQGDFVPAAREPAWPPRRCSWSPCTWRPRPSPPPPAQARGTPGPARRRCCAATPERPGPPPRPARSAAP
ncbi:LysR family transcriptional regulator [Streptomyces sp. NPDC054838]